MSGHLILPVECISYHTLAKKQFFLSEHIFSFRAQFIRGGKSQIGRSLCAGMTHRPQSQVIWGTMVRRYRTEGRRQQGQGITRNGVSEGSMRQNPCT